MTKLPLLPLNGVPYKEETEATLVLSNSSHEEDDNGGKFSLNAAEAEQPRTRKRIKQNPSLDSSVQWGSTSVCGRRKEMEDSTVALPQFLSFPSSMVGVNGVPDSLTAHVFGVYDGHGGSQVANYCGERMHLVLAEEIAIAKENWSFKNGESDWEEEWKNIFVNCFHRVDDEVEAFAPGSVGSTAVIPLVSSTHIIVGNCGDSRAVFCRGEASIPLSIDHKPNREDECSRIENAGGRIINWDGYRVLGFLAVSRSIGDRYLRPFVVADPEIMILAREEEDECLVIASDGFWDVVSNEEACNLARRRIMIRDEKNGDEAAQDAADYLVKLAFQRGSKDNISVIVVDLKDSRKFKKTT